jgi:hypothetical protein
MESEGSKKQMSLMEENIKTKGENAYYYAHKRIVDERDNGSIEQGKVITGPGIITGGDPVKLGNSNKPIEIIKENKKFTKYIFIDDDENATVKIDLPEEIKDKVTLDTISWNLTDKSLDLKVSPIDSDPYYLSVKKLFKKIIPEECSFKIVKAKLVLNLKKKEKDDEWDKLTA